MMTAAREINIDIPYNNWRPRPDQMPLWSYLENGGTRAVEVAHRRWGKDEVALHFTATQIMEKPGNYWHMLPKYSQGKKVIWNAINPKTGRRRINEAFPLELRARTNRQEMLIEFKNGSIWQVVGSDTYDDLVGSPPLGIVFSEWAISKPMAWAYLAPILEENNGWAVFVYTSRGNNHGRTTYEHALETKGWFAHKIPASETDVFTPEQLLGIKNEYIKIFGAELGLAMYEQEYECSWEGAVLGAYFAQQMQDAKNEGRVTAVPHRPGVEVDTYWDLGIADNMCIWFIQQIGKSFHVIDYYEGTGYGLGHYAKAMKGTLDDKMAHREKYVYGNHTMPHDAEHREMTNSDIAKTRKQVAEQLGIKPVRIIHRAKNMDTIIHVHIPAVREILASCWFDKDKCDLGISALENFRAEYNQEKKVLSSRYEHDWASHAATGFITFAIADHSDKPKPRPVVAKEFRPAGWQG